MSRFLLFTALLFVLANPLVASDLTVSSPSLNSTVFEAGNTISVNFTLNNIGNTASGNSYTGLYLSTDDVFDVQDVYLTSRFNTGLSSSSNEVITDQILTIPQNTPVGTYYLIMYADYDLDVMEDNELNNINTLSLTVVQGLAKDLVVSISSSATNVEQGNDLFVELTLENLGPGGVGPSFLGLYLSSNTSYEATDINVSTDVYVTGFAGNSSVTTYGYGSIPLNTPPGTYYLIARADDNGQILETDETNNTAYLTITIGPTSNDRDLFITNLSLPSSAETGANVSVNYRINNSGSSAVGYSNTSFYLSTDQTLSTGTDILLGDYLYPYLTSNDWSDQTIDLKIPITTTSGNYFILVVADRTLTIVETNETNNIAFQAITIIDPARDLTVFNPTLSSTSVEQYNSVVLGYTVKNLGVGSFPYSATKAYLSTDAVIDNQDYDLLYQTNALPLASTNYTFSYNVVIPSQIAPGNYYIIIRVDANSEFVETNENNNTTTIPITVLAYSNNVDMLMESFTSYSTSSPEAGSSVSTLYTVKNVGTSALISYTATSGYLSTDNILSADDILLSTALEYPLAAGASKVSASSFKIPYGTTPGTYFIIVHTDDEFHVTELSEANNTASIAITVVAPANRDLTITNPSLSVPSTIEAGGSFKVYYTIGNVGTVDISGSYYNGFYLSQDNLWDANDIYLGAQYNSYIPVGGSMLDSVYVGVYAGTPAGNYYLLGIVDAPNVVLESNENNNLVSLPIVVVAPDIDLTVSSIVLHMNSVTAGSTVRADFTVNNSGASYCGYSDIDVFISTDNTWDINDVLLIDYMEVPEVLSGSSFDFTDVDLEIPDYIATGNYYIIIRADIYEQIFETNEANNNNFVPIHINGTPHPDLIVVHSQLSSSTVEKGSYVDFKCYIKNIGDAVGNSSETYCFFSEDQLLDYSYDYGMNVYSSSVSVDLNPGDSVLYETSLYVQAWYDDGSFYVLTQADYNSNLQESVETNNIEVIPINVITTGTKDVVAANPLFNPEVAVANGTIDLKYDLRNTGTSSFTTSQTAIYYSDDNVFDLFTDIALRDDNIWATLSAGGSIPVEAIGLSIPSDATEGQHYLFVIVDYYDNILESDETNNILMVPLLVVPAGALDLRISAASLNAAAYASGANAFLNFTLKNSGVAQVDTSSTEIYFSTDNVLDGTDLSLGAVGQSDPLMAGEFIDVSGQPLLLPEGLANGNYYLILKADYSDLVTEFDETNNSVVVPFEINNTLSTQESRPSGSSIVCYPNPAKDEITFETSALFSAKENTIVLYNSVGDKVAEQKISTTIFQLNVSSLTPGVYTYSFSEKNERGKLVIVR